MGFELMLTETLVRKIRESLPVAQLSIRNAPFNLVSVKIMKYTSFFLAVFDSTKLPFVQAYCPMPK